MPWSLEIKRGPRSGLKSMSRLMLNVPECSIGIELDG